MKRAVRGRIAHEARVLLTSGVLVGMLALFTPFAAAPDAAASGRRLTHMRYQVTTVAPSMTSSHIGAPNSDNVAVVDPAVHSNGELFVFLPGTAGPPVCCQLILEEAASMGFAAIGLSYPNTTSVKSRCRNLLACYGNVRANEFDGSDPTAASALDPDNAVTFRLTALLSFLDRSQPRGPWARFVIDGGVDWSRVVIGGHSQGGGEAAYIGTVQRTEGVVMLSAPVDSTSGAIPEPAPYLSSASKTRRDRYVGFDHTADPSHLNITSDWSALGLGQFGSPVSVDTTSAPYRHSHELVTSVSVPDRTPSNPAHDSTAVDFDTPTCPNGSPRFAPAWRYMLQVAGGMRVSAGHGRC